MFKKLNVSWGSDPEAFFTRNGQPIGSEKLIPEAGLLSAAGRIIRDGVQFELNPYAGTVGALGFRIADLLRCAKQQAAGHDGVNISFAGVVEVSRQELDSLGPSTRVLGCMPSNNVYEERPILVDAATYRKRSAGGHIHVGISNYPELINERKRLISLFDAYVGNTAVLLDRDPGAAERRENYGRAGEYRLPTYGIEYRTTSNFWLRDPALFDLVFGLSEVAVSALNEALQGRSSIMAETVKRVNIRNVVKAIDTNNFDLAMENFNALLPVLRRNLPLEVFPLDKDNIPQFVKLAEIVNKQGIEQILPTDYIFDRWASRHENFRTLLRRVV